MEDSLKVLPGGTIQFSMRKDFPTIAANQNKNKKKNQQQQKQPVSK